MDKNRKPDQTPDRPYDPGPEVPDPAPWMGQVGEGASEPSGETISRGLGKLMHPDDRATDDNERSVSADPEMPIPDVNRDAE